MKFSDKLRMLIDEKNITQKFLASELRIPVSTLGGYVQGTSEPDFETLKIIAGYFDVTIDYLLGVHQKDATSNKEEELLRVFRALSDEQKEVYIEQGKAFLKTAKK